MDKSAKPEIDWYELKELAEILVKHADLHQGHWGPAFEFSSGGALIPVEGGGVMPSSIVGMKRVGLQRFHSPNNITVDAALVNPQSGKRGAAKATPSRPAKKKARKS